MTGTVLDAETKLPLPAVTIRCGSLAATTSQPDGTFQLTVSATSRRDTLRLSRLGYVTLSVAMSALGTQPVRVLYLHKKPVELGPVAVTARKWVERKVGITNSRALVHFTDGTLPPGKPFEIAQLMWVGTTGAELTSINLFLAAGQPDSITVAVQLYGVENDRPTSPLLKQPIYQRVALRPGWLQLNLAPHHLYLTQDVVVGLTLLPDSAQRHSVPLDIKLGGSARSFARLAGESAWRVPPHHYRLHVTVRVPDHALPTREDEAENQETPASAYLYSAAVQDSFALFVRLPKGYAQSRRRYPVVVLLDANVYFDQVGEAASRLPSREAAILVGVGRPTFPLQDSLRQRDYTYPPALPADSLPVSGGGRQFLAFLERELLPHLDHTYRTDTTQRTLMGHSLGGYFTLFALVESLKANRPAFARYVAASPSLYYADHYLLRELATLTPVAARQPPLRVVLTVGGQEIAATAEGNANKATFQEAIALLATNKFSPLVVESTIYPGYRHLETAIPTFTTNLPRLRRVPGTEPK